MRMLLVCLGIATLSLTACTASHECTLEATPSVMIDITDAAGLPLNGATVTYRIDDGELETADCWPTADDEQDGCSTYYTLAERTGSFSITAEKEGYSPAMATATVEMEEEGCHVEQQHITLRLEPVE